MRDSELDELLDRALRSYAKSEPLDGLSERIVTRVRGSRQRRPTKLWLLGLVTAAGLALATTAYIEHRHPVSVALRMPAVTPVASSVAPVIQAAAGKSIRRHARKHRVAPPKLSNEELALVRFVRTDPERAEIAFASLHDDANREIIAGPIEIKPIHLKELR